jgi:hypothetical protein
MRATQSEEEEWVRRGHVMKTIMFPGLKSPEKYSPSYAFPM